MIGSVAAKTAVVGALSGIAHIVKSLASIQKNDSLVPFTSVLRVEPITMIDKRLERVDYLPEVLQTLLSMFCGFYLQAVSCMAKVGDVNVVKLLDAINPSRDASLAASSVVEAINGSNSVGMLSMESYEGARLPRPKDFGIESIGMARAAGKARGFLIDNELTAKTRNMQGVSDSKLDTSKAIKAASENVNLAVGKMLDVTIESNGQRAVFPIQVRLATAVVESEVLTHILGSSGHDNSIQERYHRWKSGDLQFWRDLVLCQDLIDEQKKLLMKDKTGAMAEINRRRATNSVAAMATGTPSIGSASAIAVISKQTATDLERRNLGKLSDLAFRNKIMMDSLTMLLVVVDTDYESVTIYTRDIQLPSRFSVRELKTANKGTGPDIGELLKMYRAGQAAVF